MNNYVQLKDGVVFATLVTAGEILESESIVKVDVDPELLLNKKYDGKSFLDAEYIKYAVIDRNNTVVAINKTLYSSEIYGPIINNDDVEVLWTWDGNTFNPPVIIEPTEIVNQSTNSQPDPQSVIEPIADIDPTVE